MKAVVPQIQLQLTSQLGSSIELVMGPGGEFIFAFLACALPALNFGAPARPVFPAEAEVQNRKLS